jgi:hypothetical protein
VTPLGLFELADGWSSVALAPGVTSEQVQEATGFTIKVAADCPEIIAPTADELRVLEQVDGENLREIEFLAGPDAAARFAEVVGREASRN